MTDKYNDPLDDFGVDSDKRETSGDEYESMTAAEVVEKLEEAWQNEKFAPEILECRTEVVDCVMELIRDMEENISHVKRGDLVAGIHKLELDRIKYVLSSYLRQRILKIQDHALHILEQEATRSSATSSRLSPGELAFAKEYAENVETHLHSLTLRHMPSNFQHVEKRNAITRPNVEGYVFVKVLEKSEKVLLDAEDDGADGATVDLDLDNQYILRYKAVSSLVHTGALRLI
ncbi:hypothetical protein EMCRGX_G029608 [Ephydatia muelleri]